MAERSLVTDPAFFAEHILSAVGPLYLLGLADRADSLARWHQARDDARERGSTFVYLGVSVWLGIIQLRRGDLDAAIPAIRDWQQFSPAWGAARGSLLFGSASLALAYLDAGDPVLARSALDDDVLDGDDPAQPSLATIAWWYARAWLLIAESRFEEALAATRTVHQHSGWLGTPIGFDRQLPQAIALAHLGRTEEAVAAATAGVELAERWGAPAPSVRRTVCARRSWAAAKGAPISIARSRSWRDRRATAAHSRPAPARARSSGRTGSSRRHAPTSSGRSSSRSSAARRV